MAVAAVNPRLIAGWLFADLLLAFSIVALGTQDPPPHHKRMVSPTPVSTRQALERSWIGVRLSVDPDAAARGAPSVVEAVRRAIRREPRLAGRKAGIVLTFGAQNSGGSKLAHNVNRLLARVDPKLFGDVVTQDFLLLNTGGGALELHIYLFYA